MTKTIGRFRQTVRDLRVEASGAGREAVALGVGTFIGCAPIFGFHLVVCWLVGSVLRLNRIKMYAAANISNPMVAPFLIFGEVQTGAWIRRGAAHEITLATIRQTSAWQLGGDLVVGSLCVGLVLGLTIALASWALSRSRVDGFFEELVTSAADLYTTHSLTAWEFARAKLALDPIYRQTLDQEILPSGHTLLDLGCGQGLTLALHSQARRLVQDDGWPATRPAPPVFERLLGIETRSRVAALARASLNGQAEIIEGDVRRLSLPRYSAALLFDVLHMMPPMAQDSLLTQLRESMNADAVILVREADASFGWRFQLVRTVNYIKAALNGDFRPTHGYRTRTQWLECFSDLGLDATVCEAEDSKRLGNVLFRLSRPSA